MNGDNSNSKEQRQPVAFSGVDALVKRLAALAIQANEPHCKNEINAVVAELHLLDNSLSRLRHERSWVDEQDVDLLIDRLRCARQRGAQ